MKSFYESMFCLNAGACIITYIAARMFLMPDLVGACWWFALGAGSFFVAARCARDPS